MDVSLESLQREWRVARAEDDISWEIDTQLSLPLGLNVDLAENAEPFLLSLTQLPSVRRLRRKVALLYVHRHNRQFCRFA